MTPRLMSLIGAVFLFLVPTFAEAQGLLLVVDPGQRIRLPRPRPPHFIPPRPTPRPEPVATYKISQLGVDVQLLDQVAKVQVSQTFVNTGSRQLEVAFVFPLPYDGAIDRMTLMVDGKEHPAKLLDAKEARRLYEEIVRKNRDPALLEWMGTGLFRTSVFPVPPGAKRTVSLRYTQVCRRQEGLTDFLFPLSTAKYTSQAVEKIRIRVTAESREDIKNIYSPTHTIEIKRPDDRHATVTFTAKNKVPTSDFRLLLDVGKGKVGTRVLSYRPSRGDDGYFLLLASPKIEASGKDRPKKTVLFVVDRSGSMSGKKIEQARGALQYVLNNLRQGDLFNIVAYDSSVSLFRPELQRFDDETRQAALGFIEGVYAGGSTNIDGALQTALGQLKDGTRPTYVLFLTDGLPTAGQTNEMKIVANATKANHVHARIFTFGVGYDVNSRLLDKLARENFGQGEYVRPDEDIEECVARLYRRIESPVLTDVKIKFDFDENTSSRRPVNRIYPAGMFDLFAGEQLVVVGRYNRSGTAKVVVSGSVGDKRQEYDFPANFAGHSNDETFAFVEKLWAVRRVGEIIDELDLKGKNDELIDELVKLSMRHGILTPYTSFMADENTNLRDIAGNTHKASERLNALSVASGVGGFSQRSMKGSLQRAINAEAGMPASAPQADGFFAGMGAGPGGRNLQLAKDAKREARLIGQVVRNIGNRTFYQRQGRWTDSQVTKSQESQAVRIKQFSDDYFALAKKHGRTLSQYMVFDEPVLLNLAEQTYLIEP